MTEVQKDITAAMREIKIKDQEDELISLRLRHKLNCNILRHIFAEYQNLVKLRGGNGGGKG